jgi:hypothetical protein
MKNLVATLCLTISVLLGSVGVSSAADFQTGFAADPTADATYGDVSLITGFEPDPYSVSVLAGGSVDASELGGACVGQIATPPDLQVDYDSGTLPLYIFASSDEDTSLVVNTPNGEWICDDDSGGNFDPLVQFDDPQSGVYDIWVGVFDEENSNPNAMLYLSELGFVAD